MLAPLPAGSARSGQASFFYMFKTEFTGRALTFDEQIDLLQSQGLEIGDRKRALRILQNISYSRFKSYLIPLMEDRRSHQFRKGATLEQAYALYGFDRRLRELIFHELEKIEISIRTRISYASMDADAGYWFTNPDYYCDPKQCREILRRVKSEVDRSDNDAIKRFKEKYTNEFPPCWMTLEATSMGTLSTLYDALRPGKFKRKLAEYYGVSDVVFASWLHHLVYIRNTCAHHSRVWNKTLSVQAMVPRNAQYYFPEQALDAGAHIYLTLCIIKYLINTIKPDNTFGGRLKQLVGNFPLIDASQMGFPTDWRSMPFWK